MVVVVVVVIVVVVVSSSNDMIVMINRRTIVTVFIVSITTNFQGSHTQILPETMQVISMNELSQI